MTLTIIKPDGFKNWEEIFVLMNMDGFRIIEAVEIELTKEQAEMFYTVHKGKPFFGELTEFMSSGPIIVAVLQKENAVECFRGFIGSTNPAKAEMGTIRNLYGSSIEKNAIHGSDSNESAEWESKFFFPEHIV